MSMYERDSVRHARPAYRGAVPAAGALLWRRQRGQLQVAVIHRPRYDDWSWPKGKLDEGETWAGAAVREVEEETGLVIRLDAPLPRSLYSLPRRELKEVRYWTGTVVGGHGKLLHEVDDLAWLTPAAAQQRLTHPRDAVQLDALVRADEQASLDTRPVLVIRHAESVPRAHWRLDDALRPLDEHGRDRAAALAPLIAAYGIERVITSPATRCVETVEPFVLATGARVHEKGGLSEKGYLDQPEKVLKHTAKALARGVPTALCTHRPVLPALLGHLARRSVPAAARVLGDGALAKGEVLVCHVVGTGDQARVVSAERHRP